MNAGRENGLITEKKFTFKNQAIVLFFANHGDTDNPGKKGKGRRISLNQDSLYRVSCRTARLYSESLL